MGQATRQTKKTQDYQFQAVFCDSSDSKKYYFYPAKNNAKKRFLISNDPEEITSLVEGNQDWYVVDIVLLQRLLFPEIPTSHIKNTFSSSKEIWETFKECQRRLETVPVWILEEFASSFIALEDRGLSALMAFQATASSTPETDRRWQNTFEPSVKKVERPALPTLEDCTALDPGKVVSHLEEGGALSRQVSGYEPRPGQLQMVRAVTEAFNTGKHLIVEAGTGIGKSLGYLLPAALWAKLNDVPVIISTNTKNLQSQLIEKDLPSVLKMLRQTGGNETGLSVAVIKGRQNYICLKRFAALLDGGQFELGRPDLRMFLSTVIWTWITTDGDLDSLTGSGAVDIQFLQNLTSSSDECSGRACPFFTRCFLQKAREKALKANLVIANHSLVFAELSAEQPISLPKYAQLVFDEAHNLEEAATNYFTKELSPGATQNAIRRIAFSRGRKSRGVLYSIKKRIDSGAIALSEDSKAREIMEEAFKLVLRFSESSTDLFRALYPLIGQGESQKRYKFTNEEVLMPGDEKWVKLRDAQDVFMQNLDALTGKMEELAKSLDEDGLDELNLASGDVNELRAAIGRLTELQQTADMVLSGTDETYVYWIQKSHSPGALAEAYAAPLNVGEFLESNLYKRLSSVIICSATLSVSGSFKYIASRLGLDKVEKSRMLTLVAPSPFNYKEQSSLLVPTYLPDPTVQDRSYVGEFSNMVIHLSRHYQGRTLVLFTSYEMMKQSAEIVRDPLADSGIELLVQGESGSRNRITKIFREGGQRVLFGTQSFWEGVDVVGNALSCVVVARLPFVSPADPINAARCEEIEKCGGHPFFTFSIPIAVLKLRQGFGRLIRHRQDTGTVVIADTRLVTKGYGGVFRSSLPTEVKRCESRETLMQNLK